MLLRAMLLRAMLLRAMLLKSNASQEQIMSSNAYPSVGLYWLCNVDPTIGAGVAAPLNQLLFRTDSPSIYYKSGPSNTGWTNLGSGGGGGGGGGDFEAANTIRVATAFGGNFATVDNWTPPGYLSTTQVIVIESQDGGSQIIGGLTGGVDGRVITIQKILSGGGGYPANIPYLQGLSFGTENAGSLPENRFSANWANMSFGQRPGSFTARYDGTIQRWVNLFAMASNS